MKLLTFSIGLLPLLALPLSNAQQSFADGARETSGQKIEKPTDETLLNAPYRNPDLPIEERINDLMSRLTPEEKAELLHGASNFTYGKIPRIGLPEFATTDGPQGVRMGNNEKARTTAFPTGIVHAATWNPTLIEKMSSAIAEECKAVNSRIILGPGINIIRTPLGGRTFEYYGEDPYLSGKTAAGYIKGVQSRGVAPCLKHWLLNDQETARYDVDVNIGERAMREIYVRPFEIAVKEANPWTIMPSYNLIRGHYAAHNRPLNDILYKEFNWDGALISDWGAWHDTEKALKGGCTLEMPSKKNPEKDQRTVQLVKEGKISQQDLDEAVRRNLRFIFRVGAFDKAEKGALNTPEHIELGKKVAAEGMVLLKNDQSFLPLDASKIKKIAVIGPNADQHHTLVDGTDHAYRGGSGATGGPYEITPLKAIVDKFGKDKVLYAPGFRFGEPKLHSCPELTPMDPEEAAKQADVVLFFGGTDHSYDREVWGNGLRYSDKPDLNLKGDQADLIQKIVKANPKTVIVLINGAPVQVEEWHQQVPAILEAWYGGQDAGNNIAAILFGDINPSGKLPVTFGKKLTDWLSHSTGTYSFPGLLTEDGKRRNQFYAEYIWVGYRHFDKANIEPRYPFGFGLSYTTFSVAKADSPASGQYSVKITNTGKRAGAEVVQFYISKPEKAGIPMPEKELVHFDKVFLEPGETKTVTYSPNEESKRYWNENENGWKTEKGTYTLSVGTSSRDLPISYTWDE